MAWTHKDKMDLFIYCAGNLGKELITLAEIINGMEKRWDNIFFLDDVRQEKEFFHHAVYNYDEVLELKRRKNVQVAIANGEPRIRKILWDKLKKDGFDMASLIYPSPFISEYAKIGKGVIIREYCSVSMDVVIEDNVFVQTHASIGHDTRIGKHSIISSHVGIAGNCEVMEQCYIGMGAMIKENLKIGEKTIIGISSSVFRNIKPSKIVVGNPAKIIGESEGSVFGMFKN